MSSNIESTEGEIFSSDGLPPLPPLSAPVTTLSTDEQGKDNASGILDQGDDINLVQAFEVFSGKIFPPNTSSSSSFAKKQQSSQNIPKVIETPLQRLARLRMEVSELEQDLAKSNSSDDEDSGKAKLGNEIIQDLASRLSALSHVTTHNNSSPRSVQSELTSLVSRELERLQQKENSGSNDEKQSGKRDGVTYELYAAGNESTGSSIEGRLAKIEQMVNGGVVVQQPYQDGSVLERLQKIEDMATSVDLSTLDAAAARAKLIRTDLEAVAKHRSKLPLPPEDSKTITQLYEQMQSLSFLSKELPLIATRLGDLAQLHSHASDFATRLVGVEKSVVDVERLLVNFETVLDRVESGCVENVKIVEENMKHLDDRMEELRK